MADAATGGTAQGAGKGPRKAQKPKTGKRQSPGKAGKGGEFPLKTALIILVVAAAAYLLYSSGQRQAADTGALTSYQTLNSSAAPSRVNMVVVNDKRCGNECDMSEFVTRLAGQIPGLAAKQIDVETADGKKLYEMAKLVTLPAILFDQTVEGSKVYPQLKGYLVAAGPYYSLRIGSNWDPYCDPDAIHCNETRCLGRIVCRQEAPGQLDLFIMSQCPYGIAALNSMREVLSAFPGEINFTVNYILSVDEKTGKLGSLHGRAEMDEDIRQLCAKKYQPGGYKYLDYIWCRNQDPLNGSWEACAEAGGLDAAAIRACGEGDEGRKLLAENFQDNYALRISSSPTFMVNNKRLFNAISADEIQAGICGVNQGLTGCGKTLSNETTTPGGSCGG
jgi:hypothetical protein